jgi:glycosyltransferase involved in cell wall biosynthesis
MKILITTPFFSNLGGSELETIHTANAFASFTYVDKVHVFVFAEYDLKFKKNIEINSKVKFFRKPSLLGNKYAHRINKELKKIFRLDLFPLDLLYWKLIFFTKYDKVYIITKTTSSYYLPIIKLFKNKNSILVKYTTVFYDQMEEIKLQYLSKVRSNIVTSQKQKTHFVNNLNLLNTEVQEIILFNENYFLDKQRFIRDKKVFDFGILGRFSEEKQYEHAVNLIANLKNKGYAATLIIRGSGKLECYNYLVDLVNKEKLSDLITLEFNVVPYDKVYDFLDCLNCFLITSKYEGGPNVGLEVMAYGLPILSYDVGAMKDRLVNFSEFIVENEEELMKRAILILKYNQDDFLDTCARVKSEYINKFSNNLKFNYLNDFLRNEKSTD